MNIEKTLRSDLSRAWAEGILAGKEGKSRACNPYIGKNSDLAKNWDQGWKEGL